MKKIKLSIIVPVYNADKYLEDCLNSILNQKFQDFELVIVNDGSTDTSLKIINKFIKKFDCIKLVNQENMGVVGARINGYKAATGEYIGWVDADDFIDETMFEKMYSATDNGKIDIVSCNYNFYPTSISNKIKWYKPYKGTIDWKFINRNTVQWNKIIKKTLLDKVDICNLFSEIGEGAYTIAMINAKTIVTLDEPLYFYRVGQSSLSTNYNNISWYEKNIEKQIKKRNLIKNTKLEKKWGDFFDYLIIYSYILMLLIAAYNGEKQLYNDTKIKLKRMNYKANKYTDLVLKENNGNLKAFVLKNIVPNNYMITKIIVKKMLNKR